MERKHVIEEKTLISKIKHVTSKGNEIQTFQNHIDGNWSGMISSQIHNIGPRFLFHALNFIRCSQLYVSPWLSLSFFDYVEPSK